MYRNMTAREANLKLSFCGAAAPALLAALARLVGTVPQDVGESSDHADPRHKGLLIVPFTPQGTQINGFTPRLHCYALASGMERIPMLLAGADGVAFVRSPNSDESDALAALKAALPSDVSPGAPLVAVDFRDGPGAERSTIDALRRVTRETLAVVKRSWPVD